MSRTTILYEQAHPIEGKELPVPLADLFIMHMNRAFGKFPIELDKSHIERLEGMNSTWSDVSANPYDVMIRAIRKLESIKVWAKYGD